MPNAHVLIESAHFSLQNQDAMETLLAKNATELDAALTDFDADARRIQSDKMLSADGKRDALAKRAARLDDFLKNKEEAIAGIDEQSEEQRAKLVESLNSEGFTTGNPHADAIRAAELRQILRGMDPLKRQVTYREACNVGDAELIQVFEQAHPLLGLVPADLIYEQRELRASRMEPDAARMAGDLRMLGTQMRGNFRMCRQHIAPHLPPSYYGDSIADMAAGKVRENA